MRPRPAASRTTPAAAREEQLRPLPAADPHPPQGDQGRLAPVRAQLLPALPAGRAPCRSRSTPRPATWASAASSDRTARADDQPRPGRERAMTTRATKIHGQPGRDPGAVPNDGQGLNRRDLLLGGTTLAAVSALASAVPMAGAQAQAQPAATPAEAEHPRHLGRRHRHLERRRLYARHDGHARRTSTASPRTGMLFTDHYGQPSCTAGRAAFIMGQMPMRTGMTTIGIPGLDARHPEGGSDARRGAQDARAMPPRSSARTIWATATSSCRPCTASTSGSATSTT